nr:unnamed protein product [Spirometra erinaceieuropaei]
MAVPLRSGPEESLTAFSTEEDSTKCAAGTQKISPDPDGAQFVKKALVRDSGECFSEIDSPGPDLQKS